LTPKGKSCLFLPLIIFIFIPALSRAETISASPSLPGFYLFQTLPHSSSKCNFSIPSSCSRPIHRAILKTADPSSFGINKPASYETTGNPFVNLSDAALAKSDRQSSFVNSQDASDWVQRSLSEDHWIALDKLAHLLVSFSLVGIGYAVSSERGLGFSRNQARILSAGGTALIGIVKEIHDYRKGSGFSRKDLAADGLGIALGVVFFTFY
jgi:uncharacterized protein YfiM (DUF2279 family)